MEQICSTYPVSDPAENGVGDVNDMLTRARAAEDETYIAVVNHSGLYNGGSFVAGPSGEWIIQMDERPGVVLAELDPERPHDGDFCE